MINEATRTSLFTKSLDKKEFIDITDICPDMKLKGHLTIPWQYDAPLGPELRIVLATKTKGANYFDPRREWLVKLDTPIVTHYSVTISHTSQWHLLCNDENNNYEGTFFL